MSSSLFFFACNRDEYILRHTDVWSFYQSRSTREIRLVSINCDSVLDENRALKIPTHINNNQVTLLRGFSSRATMWGSVGGGPFQVRVEVSKIIIPYGVAASRSFWSNQLPDIIIFLEETPNERSTFFGF